MSDNIIKPSKDWMDGFDAGLAFCKMLSEVSEYRGIFWPDNEKQYNGFAEGTITGKSHFKVKWKWVDDGKGTLSYIEKI